MRSLFVLLLLVVGLGACFAVLWVGLTLYTNTPTTIPGVTTPTAPAAGPTAASVRH